MVNELLRIEDCFKAWRESKRKCRPLFEAQPASNDGLPVEGYSFKAPECWLAQHIDGVFEIEPEPKKDIYFLEFKKAVVDSMKSAGISTRSNVDSLTQMIWSKLPGESRKE